MTKTTGTIIAMAALLSAVSNSAVAATSHFSKVPADTPLYLGTTTETDWLSTMGLGDVESLRDALEKFGHSGSAQGVEDEARFLRSLAEAMLQGGRAGNALVSQPGRVQFYLHGAAPVLRLQLNNGDQFARYLNDLAKDPEAAVQFTEAQGQGMWTVRSEGANAELFAALDGDDLILARWSQQTGYPGFDEVVAGGRGFNPEKSLLPAIERYRMPGKSVAWLDIQQLRDNIIDTDSALHAAVGESWKDKSQWQQFLSAECQHDVSQFIANTPHIVGSVEQAAVEQHRGINAAFVWPMQNEKARVAWQGLQGLVLDHDEHPSPAQVGFGVSGSGMSNFIQYIASDLAALQCPLWRDQAAKAGMSMAMAGSMSAMFGSVKGITGQLFDFTLDGKGNPDPQSMDAQISVLTDSPSLLLLMMRSMLTLPAVIPDDGTPVPLQTPFGVPLQLSVLPDSINVFKGDQAEQSVGSLKQSITTESAIFNYAVDVFWGLSKGAKQWGKSPEELLNEQSVNALLPLAVSGGIRHLPYGLRMESNALYAEPVADEQQAPSVVKTNN